MGHRTILRSVAVLGAALLWPRLLPSQTSTRCRAQASIEKIGEDPVFNSTDVQYTFVIRVVSQEKSCVRVSPTIAFTTRQPLRAAETQEATETFSTEGPAIVTRGGIGTGRMAQQSPVKIVRAQVAAVACGPCEPGDEVVPASKGSKKEPIIVAGAGALAAGAIVGFRKLTEDTFPGGWLGQLRMRNVNTFGVDCELVSSTTYDFGLIITRDGDDLTGTCSVVPTVVTPAPCAFAVPPQSEPLRGSLRGTDFSVTCGDPAVRGGVLSGAMLAGARTGDRMSGTARTPLGETGEWELVRRR